ncbi:MAG TPA: glycosyltransferase N-terminal domain-containing protein [Moheibacter sp.]|nr:glycosyltransferase N-terminal domain-containing protein [Moheibacter sp.]
MNIIYNLFIRLYGLGISVAAWFNPKAKLWKKGRENWQQQMKKSIDPSAKVIWIHCSSLGEFEQGRPVIEEMRKKYPNHQIAVSFFSPSGYEVRKDYQGADYIFYLPLDTPKNAQQLIEILRPEMLVLVKYEYWYNLLKQLEKRQIPVVVISAVIKEKSLFFKSWGKWFREIMLGIDHFFVQEENSKLLLNSIGIDQVTVSGDTRFDRVKEILLANESLDFVKTFKGNSKLIVAGSTWAEDEEILLNWINNHLPKDWKVIIAPHDIVEKRVQSLAEALNKKTAVYTQSNAEEMNDAQILLVDTIGLLTKIYAYSDVSYVGGGFTKSGVHNTLEPAVYGVPILFGPNYQNFFEAMELVEQLAAVSFKDFADFDAELKWLIAQEVERKVRGKNAFNYIQSQPNATATILEYVQKFI